MIIDIGALFHNMGYSIAMSYPPEKFYALPENQQAIVSDFLQSLLIINETLSAIPPIYTEISGDEPYVYRSRNDIPGIPVQPD